MKLTLRTPTGIAPKFTPKKLPDTSATTAENVRFSNGGLLPWNDVEATAETPPATAVSVYQDWQDNFLYHHNWRQYVGVLLPNDLWNRFFFAEPAAYPQYRAQGVQYRLGLPRPAAPTLNVVSAGDTSDPLLNETRAYTITYVDAFGHEGPPSVSVLAIGDIGVGANVAITLPGPPASAVEYNLQSGGGAGFRIYRTNTGSSSTDYQLVNSAVISIATASYNDTVESENLLEVLVTDNWTEAPNENGSDFPKGPLQSLIELPGGILAGHAGNAMWFCEPYLPLAWPAEYRISTEEDIVAPTVVRTGTLVLTTGQPYVITGQVPGSMTRNPVAGKQPCLSAQSVVSYGDFAIYASPDGLVGCDGVTTSVLTAPLMTKKEWSTFNPSTIRGFQYENYYLGFYGDPADGTGFVYERSDESTNFTTFTGLKVYGGYFDIENDALYLLYDDNGTRKLGQFDEGVAKNLVWQSKTFSLPTPLSLSAMKVDAEAYPVDITVYGEGEVIGPISVTDNSVHRIPCNFKAREWAFKVSGNKEVNELAFSDSVQELEEYDG